MFNGQLLLAACTRIWTPDHLGLTCLMGNYCLLPAPEFEPKTTSKGQYLCHSFQLLHSNMLSALWHTDRIVCQITSLRSCSCPPTESREVEAVVHICELLSSVAVDLIVTDGRDGHIHQHRHHHHTDNCNPRHTQDEGNKDELKTCITYIIVESGLPGFHRFCETKFQT